MNKTKELLLRLREMIQSGKLSGDQIPVDVIKECIMSELKVSENTFLEEQYSDVMQSLETVYADIDRCESDINNITLFIDAMVLCIDMVSRAIPTLANGDYWSYKHRDEMDDPEILEIIDYIDRERKISLINYDFTKEYDSMSCECILDTECNMRYVVHKGRKMYFPQNWETEQIMDYYRTVVMEQDIRSPHCYDKDGYKVEEGDIVVDAGAAEGIFALDVIDIAKKIYLIEADSSWVEALTKTFENDGDKVQIVYGFLGDVSEGNNVSLNSLFKDQEVNYIKMDIEGYEKAALMGADDILKNNEKLKCAICAYHCREDERWIKDKLTEFGMITDVSKGYICPDWTIHGYLDAELRRGIVFGRK